MEPEDVAEYVFRVIPNSLRGRESVWRYVDGSVEVVVPVNGEVSLAKLKRLEERLSEKLGSFEISVTDTGVRGWSRDERHMPAVVVRYWP